MDARRSTLTWQLIRLDPHFAGKMLIIHIKSTGPRIGIGSAIYLGERAAVVLELLLDALPALLMSVLGIILHMRLTELVRAHFEPFLRLVMVLEGAEGNALLFRDLSDGHGKACTHFATEVTVP